MNGETIIGQVTQKARSAFSSPEVTSPQYASLPDYAEKPAWYVARRTPYSLIKGGEGVDASALESMVVTCVDRYLEGAKSVPADPANLESLRAFQRDMLTLGNPSSATLEKVLGKKGAETMFRTAIMPVEAPPDTQIIQ